MKRNYFYVVLAAAVACMILIGAFMWWDAHEVVPVQENLIPQPRAPFKSYISGIGIVEASSENINIGTPVNRIIKEILVKVGENVKKGSILFKLENEDLEADLVSKRVEYYYTLAKLQRLEELPRPEDLAPAIAILQSSQVALDLAKTQYEMVQKLQDQRALSQEEINRRQSNYQQAQAKFQEAEANLNKIKAGAWKPDLEIAMLEAQQSRANIEKVKAEIERTIIRAPIDGQVLQIKIHEGEFPPQDTTRIPIMILGNTDELHLRVSINQFDAPFFNPHAPAVAFLQGDARIAFPLEFVRIEPYLIYKQTLSNELTERVDTRVLQVIYKIDKNQHEFIVGQQMDVFIEAEFSS